MTEFMHVLPFLSFKSLLIITCLISPFYGGVGHNDQLEGAVVTRKLAVQVVGRSGSGP